MNTGNLLNRGGRVLRYGDTVLPSDHQVHHHLGNRTQSPPEEKWVGWKVIPVPSPTFVRMPNAKGDSQSPDQLTL
jgi:hypothetical protein